MRLILSVAGSALVVLLVLVAAGFIRGMSESLTVTGGRYNVIVMGAGSEESVERSEIDAAVPSLLTSTILGIRTRAGVAYVSPEVQAMLPIRTTQAFTSPGTAPLVMVRGITPAAALVHEKVAMIAGRWPGNGQDEVIVGRMAAAVLGVDDSELAIGKSITIDNQSRTIVGRFAAPGTVVEAEVWMPLTDLTATTRRETISCVVLTLEPYNEATGDGAEFADIDAFTKARPDLELTAITELDYYGKIASFFGPIKIIVWTTAGLISIGGLFGGLITMYAAFASRSRELGTLAAIGFRRSAILLSMIQESTLASAAGGLLACAVGLFLLNGMAVRFSMGAFGLIIDFEVVGLGLLCGLALGIIGALPPAIKCLRQSIPLALKAV